VSERGRRTVRVRAIGTKGARAAALRECPEALKIVSVRRSTYAR
jgi:hypothetical protein